MAKPTKPTTPPRKATPAGPTAKRRARPAEPTDAAPDVPASAASVVSLVSGTAPDQAEPDGADGTFRRPDLIGAVAARSALKRSEVKEVLDLVLDELGAALDARDMVILPPLGKIVIKARKGSGSASVLTAKIRRPAAQDGGASGLADRDAEG